ncbi:hypothetical protein ACQP2F_46420 (plasmid) [Actinoplanes sp. CA-030573]|uniref:hypothetical protein n=1 Tax=Actinoplanes sp. CA-030573 TaxID=3239898 RepID=UPI003D929572
MTAIVRTAEPANARPDLLYRRVTGTPGEVETTLGMVRASGHLVAASAPAAVHGDLHRVTTVVTLRRVPLADVVPAQPTFARRMVKPAIITGSILGALGGLGYLLYSLVSATVRAASAVSPVAIGFFVIVAGALVLSALARRKATGCSGLHCGGCKGH